MAKASVQIQAALYTLLHKRPACTVGLYHPFRNEPNVLGLLSNSALMQHAWALPVCEGQGDAAHLRFAAYSVGGALVEGRYGISVPAHCEWVTPSLLLIPCVGFGPAGERLGYGAGWYDRTLAQWPSAMVETVGVCFEEDFIPNLQAERHDRLLDAVVTQAGCRLFDKKPYSQA